MITTIMKTINIKLIITWALMVMMLVNCKQDVIKLTEPTTTPTTPTTPSKGNADFTKFVAIGNSLCAGYQAAALFDSGQANSFPSMMAKQFALVGGGAFNQPNINSLNGYSGNIGNGAIILGRYILFDPDGPGPSSASPYPSGYPGQTVTCPSTVTTPALPAPYNTADLIGAFTGDKTKLNNFGVPGIQLGQLLTPATGGPANPPPPAAAINPAFNPYYARFASSPSPDGVSGSTILSDAITAAPNFFLMEIGNNDVLGYATTGGNGSIPITDPTTFSSYYQLAIGSLLTALPNVKGVLATIPNVTNIPYFFTVTYNAIPLDAATATEVNAGFAGYNQAMQGIAATLAATPAAFGLTSTQAAPIITEIGTRLVTFSASANNSILISDSTLVDMGPFFDGLLAASEITSDQRTALAPYQQVRQATASDLIILPAGGVLGTCVGNNPLYINGVSIPLANKYVLIPSETAAILTATAKYNNTITTIVSQNPTRLALADINAAFATLVNSQVEVANGVAISPSLAPPTGGFSEDGVHPNTRGYAFLANIYLTAINTTFSANIPLIDISKYQGTGLPINP
jgi:hypothetical protein